MPVGDAFFVQLRGKPRGVAPCPHQRLCLWTPRRVFDPLDTHFAIVLSALSGYARVLIRPLSRRSGQRGLAAIKVNKHGCAPEGVKGAIGKPPCRARRRDSPCNEKNQETWKCSAKGRRGRPQSPRRASAEAKPLATKKTSIGKTNRFPYWSVAPIWRDNM